LNLNIPTAKIFRPLLEPTRYKGAYGGRGGGKSQFFAEALIERCILEPGLTAVCIRELQRSLSQSSKRLIETKIQKLGLGPHFEVLHDRIKTPRGGLIIFQGMQDHTAESIKSLEGFKIAWIEEAQSLSARSLALLRPTIRAADSEIWASWNPRRKSDAIDEFLRQQKPEGATVISVNWRDNPWFPAVLEKERRLDLDLYPDRYDHIWEGGYAKAFEGAYFAKGLADAKAQDRIGRVGADPLIQLRAFFDIGGAGGKADAMAIWIAQFVGRAIYMLDYIEGVGQVLAYYVAEMRKRGYNKALCTLPHDGAHTNAISGKTYAQHLEDAGFEVEVVKNQGAGAAMMRIEAVRRILPRCWFNESTTEAGRDALGYYHERKDEARNVGLGPEHDWSSHGCDAAGLMAICYEEPRAKIADQKSNSNRPSGATHWSA
jgi:phage terminase large subunit